MNQLQLFLPCAAGVEGFLADEVHRLTGLAGDDLLTGRGGVTLRASWREAMRLNLHSRLAQRVLVQLSHTPYRNEQDLYEAASAVAWEIWFTTQRELQGRGDGAAQPAQEPELRRAARSRTRWPTASATRAASGPTSTPSGPTCASTRHLTSDHATLYIDTSGEPLFKRGWREDKGEAPLKETLAAAMIAASGWDANDAAVRPLLRQRHDRDRGGAGGLQHRAGPAAPLRLREAAALPGRMCGRPCGRKRRRSNARRRRPVFGSDVAFRMVDFAQRNAERAGVADAVQFRGGDALQRMPPTETPGVMLVNPPYGERIETAGVAGRSQGGRERAETDDGGDFFTQLAAHWKKNYPGWTAWVLTPDLKLPSRMRLKESRRVPMWNGPIECRLFRFDMVQGSARRKDANTGA